MRPLYRLLAAATLSLLFIGGGVSTASAKDKWWKPDNERTVVPEIDPASLSSALALLAGGLLILRDRRR